MDDFECFVAAHLREQIASERSYVVMGSAGFSAVTLKAAQEQVVRWLMRVQVCELKTLEKAQAKELETAQKEWRKIEGQTFKCMADAE